MHGAAGAAVVRIRFHIEPKPYAEALLDLAQQANITLIGAAACTGAMHSPIVASLTVDEALEKLLEGAPCIARMVAAGTVEVSPMLHAAAQPAPPAVVAELLVTATKRVRNPRDLAVAITAIPAVDLHETGAVDIGDAVGQLAGVVATNLGPGRNKLLFRGLSDGAYTGRARSIVATYLDDIPVNYNAPDPDLRLVDVERVEVARGPQGALYGAGSLSGVYRIVTRRPDLTRFSSEIRTSGSLTRSGAPSDAIEGYVNTPVWNGVVGLRAAGYVETQGGYLDDISQMRKNVDRTERRGARLALLVQPSGNWSFSLTATGQHLGSNDTHYTTPGLGLTRQVRIPEPHVNDIGTAAATLRGSWGWGELTSSTGYIRHSYSSLYDATATQNLYTAFAQTAAYSERNRTEMLVQDLVLTSRGSGRIEWLAGLYGSYTSENSPTQLLAQVPRAPNIPVYFDIRSDLIREAAVYGEVSYGFASKWRIAAGGRAFSISTHTRSHVESERFAPRDINRGGDFSGFSPKLSVQRAFGDGNLLYALFSSGYRTGGVNSGGAQPLPASRETFAPDQLRNYETGVKLQALSKRLSLNATAFYDKWTDIQTDQFRPSGIPYTTNAGDAQILGVETEISYRAANGLSAQLNGGLSRTRITNVNPAFATRLTHGLPGAPSLSGGGMLSYERQILDDWTLRLVGQATYVGRSRVSFDATLPKMGGYTRAKLSAQLSRGLVGVQIFVSNPLNAYSDTFDFGNPFNPAQTRQITPQRPITIGLTLFAGL